MAMELSGAQKLIVDAPIENILVSAAAGSGKTTVLVERIVSKIIAGDFDIDNILVMTFTREAANNMRLKIESKIREKIAALKNEGNNGEIISRLYRQLDLLPNSYIQTIDAFCSRVIKEKGYVCADSEESELIDSGSFILDGNELKVLLSNAISVSLAEMYDEYKEDNASFLALTNMYGNGRTDDSLAESLSDTYLKLRSLPLYLDRCDALVKQREENDANGILNGFSDILELIIAAYKRIDDKTLSRLREITKGITFLKNKNDDRQKAFYSLFDVVEKYVNHVISTYENSENPFDTVEAIRDESYLCEFTKDILNPVPDPAKNTNPELMADFSFEFGKIAALIEFIKPLIELKSMPSGSKRDIAPFQIDLSYQSIFYCDYDELLKKQISRTSFIREYVEIIKRIDKNFMLIKSRVKGADFADQTHLANKILSFEEAGSYYASKFIEIYVDEYQDNSEIQDAIIDLFDSPNGNIFRVGDVKQSIYKFRYAEPKLFVDHMATFGEVKTEEDFIRKADSKGLLFLLNSNYRSDESVINFINQLFFQIMTKDGAEIEYDEKQQLNYPDTKEKKDEILPRVLLVNKENSKKNKEAMLYGVLKEVNRLRENAVDYGEICILTRKRSQADLISKYLNDNGHKAVYADELAVFEDTDIHAICNVIMSVGNSYRDEYLFGVLISPYRFSNFTFNEIAIIVAFANRFNSGMKSQYLIEKVRCFADNCKDESSDLVMRVKRFIEEFDSLRNDQIITDIGELIDRIYKESGIGATLGENSVKLNMFKDWLCSNFLRYGSDIAGVSHELESMKIKLGGGTSVSTKSSSENNAIRCMTYHSSKGLEFKAVIVTELNAKTKADAASQIVFDSRDGFVSDDYDDEAIRIDTSFEKMRYKNNQILSENAEALRLLYVALTRAKEYLSVVIPTCLSSTSATTMYKLVLASGDKPFGKSHWLNGSNSIEYAFLCGLLKLKGAEELAGLLKENSDPVSDRYIEFTGETNTFELEIDENFSSMIFDELSDASEEADETNDSDEDVVVPKAEEVVNEISLCAEGYDEDGYPQFAKYPYEEEAAMPFKVSVSGIESGLSRDTMPINLTVNRLSYYKDRLNGEVGETPSELGTFVHKMMRFIDLSRIADDKDNYDSEIDELINSKIITTNEREKALRYKSAITDFAVSDIGRRLIDADLNGLANYEKPIVFAVPCGEENDSILVQGIIDLLFEENGEYVLVDYKTDRFPEAFDSEMISKEALKRHKAQVKYYRNAVEASGMKVKESYLYLVNYGQLVCV